MNIRKWSEPGNEASFYAYFTQVHCSLIACFYVVMGCIIIKRLIILWFTVQEEDQFLCKFQVHCSHRLPVFTWLWPALYIIMYCQD